MGACWRMRHGEGDRRRTQEKVEVGAVVIRLREWVLKRVGIRVSDVRRGGRRRQTCGRHGAAREVGEVGRAVEVV